MYDVEEYDYVICGGGMAGLSLAYRFTQSLKLSHNKILIIDKEKKTKNDRTWGFWEKGNSIFETIIHNKWSKIYLFSEQNSKLSKQLKQYRYKILRGIDFYKFTQERISQYPNICFEYDNVSSFTVQNDRPIVHTSKGKKITAKYIFDSISPLPITKEDSLNFLQHFYGQVLHTKEPFWDTSAPELMNYNVSQIKGECHFIYVLPFSETKALVEYTIFSESVCTEEQYQKYLNSYLQKTYEGVSFELKEQEYGIIPMTDSPAPASIHADIIKIGIAGATANPSTGYTFTRAQKKLATIIENLEKGKSLNTNLNFTEKKHLIYASTLLQVLKNKKVAMSSFFYSMFEKNDTEVVFSFLDGTSTFFEDLKIMWNTPILHFGAAFFQTLFKKIKKV